MPNNFFSVDSRFPNIENKTQEQINGEVINYLFLLLEQLRYTMGNLGVSNFNATELDDLQEMITEPVYAMIKDAEGNITTLQADAKGLTARVEAAEGNVAALTLTAEGLASRVEDAEGNLTTLTQTSNELFLRIENSEGAVASLTLSINNIAAVVGSNSLMINDLGIQIAGKVSFTNLSTPGMTVIDAGNVTTGTLNAINITNSNFYSYDAAGRALLIGNGSFTIYNGFSMIGGMYINSTNEMLVLHSTKGLQLDASVKIAGESTIGGYLILHMGNIASNAASIRALLGI